MIEPIRQAEFEAARRKGRMPSEEGQAVRDLRPNTGVKFPCRWNHTGELHQCAGAALAYDNAQKAGFRVRCHCKDKVVYVFRYE